MHNYQGTGKTYFNYNSDFSGDVEIMNMVDDTIRIPAHDILEFVAYCYKASNKISKLEQMNYLEILE